MSKRDALNAKDKMMLLGFEGLASNAYFEVLPWLILNQKDSFPFNGRNRRPPKDAVLGLHGEWIEIQNKFIFRNS